MGLFDKVDASGRILGDGSDDDGGDDRPIAREARSRSNGRANGSNGSNGSDPSVEPSPPQTRRRVDRGPRFPELIGLLGDCKRDGAIARSVGGERIKLPCVSLVLHCVEYDAEIKSIELDESWDPKAIAATLESRMEAYAEHYSTGGDLTFSFGVTATFYDPATGGKKDEQVWENRIDLQPPRRAHGDRGGGRAAGRDAARPEKWVQAAFNEKGAAVADARDVMQMATDALQESVRELRRMVKDRDATIERLQKTISDGYERQQSLMDQSKDREIKDRRAKRLDDAMEAALKQLVSLGKPMVLGIARKWMSGGADISEAENRARNVVRMTIAKLKEKTGGDEAQAEMMLRAVGFGDEEIAAFGILGADLAIEDLHKRSLLEAQVAFGGGYGLPAQGGSGGEPPNGRGPVRSLVDGLEGLIDGVGGGAAAGGGG